MVGHQMLHQTQEVGGAQQAAVLSSLIYMIEDQRRDLWGWAGISSGVGDTRTTHPPQWGSR